MEFVLNLEQIHPILQWVLEQVKSMNFEPAALRRIELASEEALVNIFNHAYQGQSEKVEIQIKSYPLDHIEITFIDYGPPFNPLTFKSIDPNLPFEKREAGGLGIHLMRQCIDEILYSRVGEKNMLIFIIRSSSSQMK